MKKIILLSTLSVLLSYTSIASAKDGIYITGKLGTSVLNNYGNKSDLNGDDITNGNSKISSHTKGVFGGGAALGYDFNEQYQLPVRVELDLTFRGQGEASGNQNVTIENMPFDIDVKNKVRTTTYMINGYYDFHNSTDFVPYVSVGMGIAHLKLQNNLNGEDVVSGSSNNFAWGVGLGAKYLLTNNISVDASYKYINAGKAKASFSGTEDGEFTEYHTESKSASNDFMVGITYSF